MTQFPDDGRHRAYQLLLKISRILTGRIVPQPPEWQRAGNEIDTAMILAGSYFVFMRGFYHSHRRRRFFVLITRFSRTKYNLSTFTPLRFCWYLNHNNRGFLASRILKAVVKVAVLFCSELNYATRRSIPVLFRSDGVSAWHQILY